MMPGSAAMTCTLEGCSAKQVNIRGWCEKHYTRYLRHGDPLGGRKTMNGEPERYFREVVLAYEGDECLAWPYATNRNGYGQIRIEGVLHNVHRLACETVNGQSPGHEAAHSCGVRICCNPQHLSWKTPAENWADRYAHGTHQTGERNHSAKLTDLEVKSILGLINEGVTQVAIAAQFGVSPQTISRVANGLRSANGDA
jgi:hypothetical protein